LRAALLFVLAFQILFGLAPSAGIAFAIVLAKNELAGAMLLNLAIRRET